MKILEILRWWQTGKSVRSIRTATGYDRATISKYIRLAEERGINQSTVLDENIINELFAGELKASEFTADKQLILEPFLEDIKNLVTNKDLPLKPKSAFENICQLNGLEGKVSYTTFKRFIKQHNITKIPKGTTCRVETAPGEQIQVDYFLVGLIPDPDGNGRRKLYAFVATLSCSRHKYSEVVFSQNQKSFVESNVKMLNYFGGVPSVIRIDNLKSGVIKVDICDPLLNRSYAEFAGHYGVIIDPCRARTPKDKGKVERDVQTVREAARQILVMNPNADILTVNLELSAWLINKYGQRPHGTTGRKPYEHFLEEEKPLLMSLPEEQFEVAQWIKAKVHPDHYIQVLKKSYSIPHAYVGKEVMVKAASRMIYVFYNNELIKQHIIPQGRRQTDISDFPDNMKAVLSNGMPLWLRRKAAEVCTELEQLMVKLLSSNSYTLQRRARGILDIARKHSPSVIAEASKIALEDYSLITAREFGQLADKIYQRRIESNSTIKISPETEKYLRSTDYYTTTNN